MSWQIRMQRWVAAVQHYRYPRPETAPQYSPLHAVARGAKHDQSPGEDPDASPRGGQHCPQRPTGSNQTPTSCVHAGNVARAAVSRWCPTHANSCSQHHSRSATSGASGLAQRAAAHHLVTSPPQPWSAARLQWPWQAACCIPGYAGKSADVSPVHSGLAEC